MKRKALLLGFFATGSQVLLLRELVSSLNGNEVFIGTALFGWLIWVALGAFLGGRQGMQVGSGVLFSIGAVLLPVTVVMIRLAPLVFTDTVGEVIPFTTAAFISVIMMLPVGVVSGWLFPSITRGGTNPVESVVHVYLFEGIGAFSGGILILVAVGGLVPTLGMAIMLGVFVVAGCYLCKQTRMFVVMTAIVIIAAGHMVAGCMIAGHFDSLLDGLKYEPYQVEESFDTHYGHQTVLSRDSMLVLLSDNMIEVVYPDPPSIENMLIPPLVYNPSARQVLFIGRSEFGVSQLADSLDHLSITAVDPRCKLGEVLEQLVPNGYSAMKISKDPMSFVSEIQDSGQYDVIIINPGELDSYKNSRLFTDRFLEKAKSLLREGGIFYIPTRYDTDCYITSDEERLLSIIYGILEASFDQVIIWPGQWTLFLASDQARLDIPYDTILTRLSTFGYEPQYINDNYLYDRLSPFKVERLNTMVGSTALVNSLEKPVLPHYQARYRSRTSDTDQRVLSLIYDNSFWLVLLLILVVGFFVVSVFFDGGSGRFGLFLYFTAGVVSISLELISFYVYQSMAGSLYSEMAALIGTFMLGLAVGTYCAFRVVKSRTEYGALIVLLAATALFLISYRYVPSEVLLLYHALFLFVTALATGSLFVAATRHYYHSREGRNRGFGYALELVGSSIGALLSTSILLPMIGLTWLLIILIILTAVTLVGSTFCQFGPSKLL